MTIFEKRVVSGLDDVEQNASSGAMSFTSGDLNLGTDGTKVQTVGIRFTGIDIPKGAIITSAYLQFQTDEVRTGATSLLIRGEDADDTAAFANVANNVSSRTTTDAAASWSPEAWTTVGEAGLAQRTPDLSAIVQEIVSRGGWSALNDMAFIITGTGDRTAESFEGGAARAPLLHIEYVMPTGNNVGSISISDVTITEGDAGTKMATFTVSRTGTAGFSVNYATADDTATANSDYVATLGTLTFAQGQASQSVSVTINGDTAIEGNETFFVNLTNPTNGGSIVDGQGLGTISNDDAPPPVVGDISITDLTITEGNSGTKTATFTVSRTGALAFTVDYATADGTATANSDYLATSGTLTFAQGQLSQSVSVTINGDTAIEPNETFFVNLTNPTNGGTILDGQGVGTISNDDVVGNISISDVTITEGNNGAKTATFTVSRTGTLDFNVDYATADGTATANSDYLATSGTLTFAQGQLSQSVSVTINGDTAIEPNETFFVNLTNPTNGGTIVDNQGLGTISNDDGAPPALIFEKRVVSGLDDVEQAASGAMSLASGDLELVTDGTTVQTVGIRFTGIDIPQGAVITSAYLHFQTDEVKSGATSLLIRGEDVDDAAAFANVANNVSSRTTTDAAASWSPAAWTTVGEAGLAQRTPDLSAILQEIVSRSGWSALNDMAFIITGTGTRTAEAFEGGAARAPLLHIEYVIPTGSNGAPTLDLDASATGTTGYAAIFTENAGAVAIADVDVLIADADDVNMERATLTLTNAQAGDQLLVNNLPAGITVSSASTATTVILTGSATIADYQTALRQVSFNSTSENPATTARVINVTVNDGIVDSNIAVATIAIDRAPDAAGDIATTVKNTAVTTGNVLLNDDQGDGPATIPTFDAVSARGGTVANNGNGTFTYTPFADFTGADTFGYTIRDADGDTSSATVSVTVTSSAAPQTLFRFAVFGDFGDTNTSGEQAVAALVAGWNVDFILAAGDNQYGSVTYDQSVGRYYSNYVGNYAGAFGSGSTINRFFPVLGNHDYHDAGLASYLAYFTLPDIERYYDFQAGSVHFFALNSNSEEPDGVSSGSRQAQWLQAGLTASDAAYNVVTFHHTAYTSGGGGTSHMRWPFEAWGADAVFAGHVHEFDLVLRDDNGDSVLFPYVTTGLGGAGNSPPNVGANLVTVTDSGMLIEFYTVDGVLRNSYFIGAPAGGNPLFVNGNDIMNGAAGKDYLWGLGGNDTLSGFAGDDMLIGGDGNDLFVFGLGDGHDTIADFIPGLGPGDRLDLRAFGIGTAGAFQQIATNQGPNVLVDLGGGDQISLLGVQEARFFDDDFLPLGPVVGNISIGARSGTLNFAADQTSQDVTVTNNGDTTIEPNETFFVNLTNASGGTILDGVGQGTITNDDGAPPALNVHVLHVYDTTQYKAGDPSGYGSGDPSGLAYVPSMNTLFIADSEHDESPYFSSVNLFAIRPDGTQINSYSLRSFTREPTGLAYNPINGLLYITDDDNDKVFWVDPANPSVKLGEFSVKALGITDAEDPKIDPVTGNIYMLSGAQHTFFELTPTGALVRSFGLPSAITDAEGLAYDAQHDVFFIASGATRGAIFELDGDGNLLATNTTLNSYLNPNGNSKPKIKGLELAPSSDPNDGNHLSLYAADYGQDQQNDGRVFEIDLGPDWLIA